MKIRYIEAEDYEIKKEADACYWVSFIQVPVASFKIRDEAAWYVLIQYAKEMHLHSFMQSLFQISRQDLNELIAQENLKIVHDRSYDKLRYKFACEVLRRRVRNLGYEPQGRLW